MKRLSFLAMLVAMVLSASAQYYMHVWSDGATYSMPVLNVDSVTFTDGPLENVPNEPLEPAQGIGVFSVAEGKTVTFSPGNLQYTQSTNTWSFAENQWDYLGTDNVTGGSVSSDPTRGDSKEGTALADKVDLFGWSTSATNFGVSTSIDENDYSGSFIDWGTNKIGNDAPNTWRTMTFEEWRYLTYERENYSLLCGVAQICGVNGLILLPDNWVCPSDITFKPGFHSNYGVDYFAAYQTFSAEQWSKMEAAGAVFLPAAGSRYGTRMATVGYDGIHWSITNNEVCCYFLHITSYLIIGGCNNRYLGFSVRLVKDLEDETTEPETPEIPIPNPDIVNGVGVFSVSASRTVTFSPGNLQYHPKNDVWRFAEHQSISLDSANLNIAPDYDGWLDLFGWSGSAGPAYGVSSSYGDIYDGAFVDWGRNQIGEHAPNTWRTLSIYEWEYLLFNRENAASLHFGAIVNGKHGRVLLPDNWEEVKPLDFEAQYEYNIIQWNEIEALGAVFLPAGGTRVGDFQLTNYQNWGSYWTSTTESYDCNWAYHVSVSSYSIILNYSTHILRFAGKSVRLVKDLTNSETNPDNTENGYEYVDLGLTVKWATCNVGANAPEEYGDYFAWGEVEPKEKYTWENYKWCQGNDMTLTKYCKNEEYGYNGFTDYENTLYAEDDVAKVKWGGAWRMPTDKELEELIYNCTWIQTNQHGVEGYKVIGYNGNNIFIPCAGRLNETIKIDEGIEAEYWSNSLVSYRYNNYYHISTQAYSMSSFFLSTTTVDRFLGLPIRPVCE